VRDADNYKRKSARLHVRVSDEATSRAMSKVPLHVGGSTAAVAATPPPPVDPGSDSDSDQDRYSLHEPQFVIHAVDDDRRRRLSRSNTPRRRTGTRGCQARAPPLLPDSVAGKAIKIGCDRCNGASGFVMMRIALVAGTSLLLERSPRGPDDLPGEQR
jgi:hypothetical protein